MTAQGLVLKAIGARLEKLAAELVTHTDNIGDFLRTLGNPDSWKLQKLSAETKQTFRDMPMVPVSIPPPARIAAAPRSPPLSLRSPSPRPSSAPQADVSGLNGPKQQILNAVATFVQAGVPPRLAHIANFCGTTKRSRGFEENIRQMRSSGMIETKGDCVYDRTDGGVASTMESGMAALKAVLSEPQYKMLEAVRRPGVSAESLAGWMNTTLRARGFEENLRRLRADDLLVGGKDSLQVADWLR